MQTSAKTSYAKILRRP